MKIYLLFYRWTYKKAAVLGWHIDKCDIEDIEKTTPIKEIHAYKEPVLLNGLSTCRNFKQWNSFWTENLGIFIVIFFCEHCSAILKIIVEQWSETQEWGVINGLQQNMCKN